MKSRLAEDRDVTSHPASIVSYPMTLSPMSRPVLPFPDGAVMNGIREFRPRKLLRRNPDMNKDILCELVYSHPKEPGHLLH
jgi:hypothetical protein